MPNKETDVELPRPADQRTARRNKRRLPVLGVVIALSLIAAACGSDGSDQSNAATSPQSDSGDSSNDDASSQDEDDGTEDNGRETVVAEGSGEEPSEPADPRLPEVVVDESLTIPYKSIDVLDSTMSYLESGEGDTVLFVHGNPTSAYLWRNVIPYVAQDHRAIAVDLIGMGRSGKPEIDYTFEDQYQYFEAFIEELGIDRLTFVAHDWGAALAWEYAQRNPERVIRFAFMEGLLPPAFPAPSFEALGDETGPIFRALKDDVEGENLVIDGNMFIEQVLPGFVDRPLGDEAMEAYRAPYLEAEDRWPMLVWPREVPIAGEPAEIVQTLNEIEDFMTSTEMPVLLAYAEPGVLVPPKAVDWYVERIANLETAYVGRGLHFIQEDQPDAIGRAIQDWLRRN